MTDPAAELRDLVDQLARVHDAPIMQAGRLLRYRQQRGLLTILAEASAPTISSGGRGGAFGPRITFDPTASELHTNVRARIRRWAEDAGVPKHWAFATSEPVDWRDAARLLTAWHARTLHTDPERWIPTLAGWVATITDLVVDPPHRSTIDAPCPRCGARWAEVVIDDTDPEHIQVERIDALQVTLRDPVSATEIICRNRGCGARWAGLDGAETLQDELHQLEHTEHGIPGCASFVKLGPLLELQVSIPLRANAYA